MSQSPDLRLRQLERAASRGDSEALEQLKLERIRQGAPWIDLGEGPEPIEEIIAWDFGMTMLRMEGGAEYLVAESTEAAGRAARERWADMAETDPEEFTCLVGSDNLIQWGLGRLAGPGSTHVRSLEEWLDLWLETPAEEWASYDGCEIDVVVCSRELERIADFKPTVAYRCN